MSTDRLAEIEREWAHAENGSDKDDVQWLIGEVKRLRARDASLTAELQIQSEHNLKLGSALEWVDENASFDPYGWDEWEKVKQHGYPVPD